jgi:alkanesulfonate monooxygenase SsuD/methylene tetrahydromethanopterin reductase-like flavin-dependent oxidoreductase (luciferase family)
MLRMSLKSMFAHRRRLAATAVAVILGVSLIAGTLSSVASSANMSGPHKAQVRTGGRVLEPHTVVDVAGFSAAGERIRAAFASRDFDAMAAAVPDAMVDAMSASGTPAQVAAKLSEFGRHIDHVIVYPASFGMTDERSREVTADLLKAAAPG